MKLFIVLLLFSIKCFSIEIEYGYSTKPQCSRNGTEFIYIGNILTSQENFKSTKEEIRKTVEFDRTGLYDGHIQAAPGAAGIVITPDPQVSVTPIYIRTQFSFDIYTQMAQKMRLQNPNKDPWPTIIALHYLTKASKMALENELKLIQPVLTPAQILANLVLKKSISAYFDLTYPGGALDKIRVDENKLQTEYEARKKIFLNDPLFTEQINADTATMNNIRNLIEKKLVNEKKKVFVIAHGVGSLYTQNAVNSIQANVPLAVPHLNNVFALLSVGKDAQSYGNSNTDGKYRTIASIEGKEYLVEAGYVNYQLQSPPVFTNANEMLDIYLNEFEVIS
jgi:hypothetical protein